MKILDWGIFFIFVYCAIKLRQRQVKVHNSGNKFALILLILQGISIFGCHISGDVAVYINISSFFQLTCSLASMVGYFLLSILAMFVLYEPQKTKDSNIEEINDSAKNEYDVSEDDNVNINILENNKDKKE